MSSIWLSIEEIEPRLFSFNAPLGACLECDGLGIEKFLMKIKLFLMNHVQLLKELLNHGKLRFLVIKKKCF